MSSSLEYFNRGIANAFARRRRAMQQQTTQQAQHVVQNQKVDNSVSDANAITNITINTSTIISTDEQYKKAIVQSMIVLIKKRRVK